MGNIALNKYRHEQMDKLAAITYRLSWSGGTRTAAPAASTHSPPCRTVVFRYPEPNEFHEIAGTPSTYTNVRILDSGVIFWRCTVVKATVSRGVATEYTNLLRMKIQIRTNRPVPL